MGKSAKAAPAPNYQAAAEADRYNQFTPLGNSTWQPYRAAQAEKGHWEGGTSTPTASQPLGGTWQNRNWVVDAPAVAERKAGQYIELNPNIQSGLDAQLGKIGSQGAFDLKGVNDIYNKAYSAMTSRLDPQWASREDQERTRLANQGLSYGNEAYTNAMKDFNQARNDAYQQATLGAIQTMPQTYQLAEAAYNQPLNWINALGSGAQISPAGGGLGNGSNLQAAIAQGQAGQNAANINAANNNAMMNGLFGLGAAALMFSDRRLKTDVSKVGKTDSGLPVYTYRYKGDPRMHMGVMAQDVEKTTPEAVHEIGGYKAVDYSRVQ